MVDTQTVFFEEEKDIGEDVIIEYDITSSPRDLTPANIVDMIDSGIIEIPLFQRNYVWDHKKASKLVESLLLGLPVPELFFYSDGDDDFTYKIIDGQQRFLSIYFFVKGRFPKNTDSRLMLLGLVRLIIITLLPSLISLRSAVAWKSSASILVTRDLFAVNVTLTSSWSIPVITRPFSVRAD